MTVDETRVHELDDDECRALLAATEVGRVGFVIDGQPFVVPVNYVFEDGSVIVRTGFGTLLTGASLAPVAFEIDGFDGAERSGWSVQVQGMGHDVTDALDARSEHVQTVEVSPWAPGDKPRLLRIDARTITGRRFGRASTA